MTLFVIGKVFAKFKDINTFLANICCNKCWCYAHYLSHKVATTTNLDPTYFEISDCSSISCIVLVGLTDLKLRYCSLYMFIFMN